MLNFLFGCITNIINFIISLLANIINIILSVLPNSPFLSFSSDAKTTSEFLPYLAWFLPVKSMFITLTAWLSCMLIYYVYSVVMRWIKLIE
ncbi:TPA: hypothetical protein KNJ60_003882 [Clostridioides difficile]|nr:hypothetical protein [Clostridioides difficile]